jgi:DNA polymerase-3 subunit epsilon
MDVFIGQLNHYAGQDYEDADGNVIEQPLSQDMDTVHKFCVDDRSLDVTNRLKLNADGVAVFNFGKYQGKPVGEVCAGDHGFYTWLMNKDFTQQVKGMVKKYTEEYKKEQKG